MICEAGGVGGAIDGGSGVVHYLFFSRASWKRIGHLPNRLSGHWTKGADRVGASVDGRLWFGEEGKRRVERGGDTSERGAMER